MSILAYLVVFFGVINLIRMAMFLVGSDIYSLLEHLKNRKQKRVLEPPTFSVVVPAHNEEKTIIRNLNSIFENDYSKKHLQVVFVDDGSTDKTLKLVREFKKRHKYKNLVIVTQKNQGKANALNNGLINYATGELVMCLDADSYIQQDALSKAARYFRNKEVVALASNVKIMPRNELLNTIQMYEYLICYQMKRAQTVFNIEYIIGGIGSTFRRSMLEKVGFYDGDTITEDIDLTMKIIRRGNKKNRVIYGADVVAYTESALTLADLIRQRYRWKYGRTQTFYKNVSLFFNYDKKYSKGLTFFYLPFAIYGDIAFLLEPLLLGFIIYITIIYGDTLTLLSAYTLISAYICMNILAEDTFTFKQKLQLLLLAPTMYVFFYLLSFVEYVALVKTIFNLKKLRKSLEDKNCSWIHIKRKSSKFA